MAHNALVHHAVTDDLRDQASLFSLGLLESGEAAIFEAHTQECELCAEELRASVALVACITATLAEDAAVAPAPHVKEKLLRRIGTPASLNVATMAGAIVRADEGRWHSYLPGIDVKRLFVDPVTRSVTSLLRVAAGAVYPAHRHAGLEHMYVVDGDAIFDDHTLNTGDYEARRPESLHSTVTSTDGCLLLVIHHQHDEIL